MKSNLLCLGCLVKQAINTALLATDNPEQQREIVNRTAEYFRSVDLSRSPADISTRIYRIVTEVTGNKDPYADFKKRTNREALELLPAMRKAINESSNPLLTALHVAVAGNIIDLGIGMEFDLEKDLKRALETSFAIDHSEQFKTSVTCGTDLLYIGDNSGEIVFDMALVELLIAMGVKVTFAVKSGPIINDVLKSDAEDVGLNEIVPVIETGSDDIGVNFERVSPEFMEVFTTADVILAKGHGNFESCNERPENIFFLLKAKCPVVAGELAVDEGDVVFKKM